MLKLVKRKTSKQSNHEKIAEADGRAAEPKDKEKGKKSLPFKIKGSSPKEVDGRKVEREKEKEKRSPTAKVQDLVQRELSEKTVENDKQKGKGKKSPTSKVIKNSAQIEVEALREEVYSLKQQLQENEKITEELKSQKTQQICSLTFKLANAMRQREKAEGEQRVLRKDTEELKTQLQEAKRKADTTQHTPSPDISGETKSSNDGLNHVDYEEFSDLDSVNSDDTAILCTSTNLLQLEKEVENAEKRAVEIECEELPLSNVSGLQGQPSTLYNSANSTLSYPGFDEPESKDVNLEITEIQKELRNVRDSMRLMQGLNQRLSEDLQQFSEFQKCLLTGSKAKSPGRQRKLGTRHAGHKCKEQGSGSSSSSSPEPLEEEEREQGGALTRVPDLLHGSTPSLTERPMKNDSLSKSDQEVQVTSDNEIKKRTAEVCYEDEIRKAEERARQLEDEDESLRQQLKKVITNTETLKADNNEMKQELRKLSSPVKADSEFLIKTTLFTDKLLREMKQRDLQVRQNLRPVDGLTCKEQEHCETTEGVTQKTTGTKLVDRAQSLKIGPVLLLKKELNDLNHSAEGLVGSPGDGTANLAKNTSNPCSPKPSMFGENITPHKLETVRANNAFETKRQSKTSESQIIGEESGKSPTRKLPSSLEKEEEVDSSDRFRSFLHDTLDYGIQRYVVRSSETIANLRDLKPEELAYY